MRVSMRFMPLSATLAVAVTADVDAEEGGVGVVAGAVLRTVIGREIVAGA